MNGIGGAGALLGVMGMEMGSVDRGPEPDAVFNSVHEYVTRRARRYRSRVIPLTWYDLIDTTSRELALPWGEVSEALQSLQEQTPTPWLEKVDQGFQVLVEKICQNFTSTPGEARPLRGKLSRSDGLASRPSEVSASAASTNGTPKASEASRYGVMEESAQNYPPQPKYPHSKRVVLARHIFPDLCLQAGIQLHPMQFSWTRLAQGISQWQTKYRVDLDFVRQMMDEFAHHPEMSQHSRLSPERTFLARRQKLTDLVVARHQADPGSRRHTGGADYWLTPVSHRG